MTTWRRFHLRCGSFQWHKIRVLEAESNAFAIACYWRFHDGTIGEFIAASASDKFHAAHSRNNTALHIENGTTGVWPQSRPTQAINISEKSN